MANVNAFRAVVGSAMPVQVAWAILAAIWNGAGVWLIAQGQRAPGPTASLGAAVMLLAMAVAFVVTVSRWPVVYLLLSIAAGLFGLAAVVNAFIADPALWPSEFWRYAGAVLNGGGFLACAATVAAFFTWKSRR
jgi:TctA family transporter